MENLVKEEKELFAKESQNAESYQSSLKQKQAKFLKQMKELEMPMIVENKKNEIKKRKETKDGIEFVMSLKDDKLQTVLTFFFSLLRVYCFFKKKPFLFFLFSKIPDCVIEELLAKGGCYCPDKRVLVFCVFFGFSVIFFCLNR